MAKVTYHRRKDSSAKVGAEHTCSRCGGTVAAGGYFLRRPYRTRATCQHEANHAGSWYPVRGYKTVCESCMVGGEADRLAELKP